jgi:hypothetical protein
VDIRVRLSVPPDALMHGAAADHRSLRTGADPGHHPGRRIGVPSSTGQSSYAITADIYSHVCPAQQGEAADRLDEATRW